MESAGEMGESRTDVRVAGHLISTSNEVSLFYDSGRSGYSIIETLINTLFVPMSASVASD